MTRRVRIILIMIIILGAITAVLFPINNLIILTRINYKINYNTELQNSEIIIEKSESFDYEKYCTYRDYDGEGPINNSDDYYYYHIDRDLIESLRLEVEDDKVKFHFWPFYKHKLFYSLEATNEPFIYLTYNNDSIIKAEYANHTVIFAARSNYYINNSLFWEGNWYLNFTHIPSTSNITSMIILNDVNLVKMYLHYDYVFGNVGAEYLRIEQHLCFDSNFNTIFVYFPLVGMLMA